MDQKLARKLQQFGLRLGGNHFAANQNESQWAQEEQRKRLEEQQRQARMGQLSEGRRVAAAQDFRGTLGLLNAGFTDQAVTKLNERLKIGSMLPDFDPQHTLLVKELITNGEVDKAKDYLSVMDQQAVASGYVEPMPQPQPIKLGKDDRLVDPTTNEVLVSPMQSPETEAPIPELPESLVSGQPPEVRQQAQDAYAIAGGGNVGLNAAQRVIENGQAAEEAVESENKARGVQVSAIKLAASIFANPETTDVVGPLQGRGANNWLFDSDNSNAISDIEELADILTTENLDLMTGVLSESDIKLLRSVAGGGLDRRRSDEVFMRRIEDIIFSLANASPLTRQEMESMPTADLAAYKKVLESRKTEEEGA